MYNNSSLLKSMKTIIPLRLFKVMSCKQAMNSNFCKDENMHITVNNVVTTKLHLISNNHVY